MQRLREEKWWNEKGEWRKGNVYEGDSKMKIWVWCIPEYLLPADPNDMCQNGWPSKRKKIAGAKQLSKARGAWWCQIHRKWWITALLSWSDSELKYMCLQCGMARCLSKQSLIRLAPRRRYPWWLLVLMQIEVALLWIKAFCSHAMAHYWVVPMTLFESV
jgi:hypothetical protein